MLLPKTTPCQRFDIHSIRWKQRVIGLASYRISTHNEVHIGSKKKDGTLYYPDTYYISGEDARKCETQQLGSGIELYLIPLSKMEILERT